VFAKKITGVFGAAIAFPERLTQPLSSIRLNSSTSNSDRRARQAVQSCATAVFGAALCHLIRFLLAICVIHGYHHIQLVQGSRASVMIGGLMSSVDSLTRFVHELKSPDARTREDAARIIWERFSPRLKLLVRRHLDNRIFRREDEHDILQSMFASFYSGQSRGKATPASREELWKLLVRITMCKIVNAAKRHMADRRDFRRERPDGRTDPDDSRFPRWMLDHVDRSQPSPQEQVAVVEEVDRLLGMLDEPLRQIVVWRIEGFTNEEISCMIGRTVRLVEYKLNLVRKLLEHEIGPANARLNPTPRSGNGRVHR
jgi:DNA-directed RNA polymerase specialized sigma24 family protein